MDKELSHHIVSQINTVRGLANLKEDQISGHVRVIQSFKNQQEEIQLLDGIIPNSLIKKESYRCDVEIANHESRIPPLVHDYGILIDAMEKPLTEGYNRPPDFINNLKIEVGKHRRFQQQIRGLLPEGGE